MDSNEPIVLVVVAIAALIVFAVALPWRRMIRQGPGLPLWEYLRRERITRGDAADSISAKAVMQAELACAVCGSRQACRSRLAASREAVPPANCPNAVLFDDFGIGVEKTRQ